MKNLIVTPHLPPNTCSKKENTILNPVKHNSFCLDQQNLFSSENCCRAFQKKIGKVGFFFLLLDIYFLSFEWKPRIFPVCWIRKANWQWACSVLCTWTGMVRSDQVGIYLEDMLLGKDLHCFFFFLVWYFLHNTFHRGLIIRKNLNLLL